MENKENEEYRKRIKELVDKLENNQDKDSPKTEQDLIEAKEKLLQTAKSRIHPNYRSERIILAFVYTIRDYYRRRATEKKQFQQEIDNLYRLIFEELIKQNPLISHSDRKFKKKVEKLDRKRIIRQMTRILGMENLFRDFYKYYDIKEATRKKTTLKKEILQGILKLIVVILGVILYYFCWRSLFI